MSQFDKCHPDVLSKALELGGVKPAAAKPARGKVELVEAAHPAAGVWVIPYECVNESNKRVWQARNRRAGAAWKAVRAAVDLGELAAFAWRLRRGQTVRAKFVRLGGRRLDRLANLPSSLKGVEDAICYLLGVDDSSPLWAPTCEQEPGGPCGVRVELSVEG